jgi:hypothetical protein
MSNRKNGDTEVKPLTVEEIKAEMFSELNRMQINDRSDSHISGKNNQETVVNHDKSIL